jgi:hypothetical protein
MILLYFIFLFLTIAGAIHFYEKRKGWWLVLSVFNIALYSYLILTFLAENT